MSNIEYFPGQDYDVAILKESGVSVFFKNSSPSTRPGTTPTMPIVDPYYPRIMDDVEHWGEANDFPQRVIELYSKDPIIPKTLDRLATKIIGNGLMAVEVINTNTDGTEVYKSIADREIKDFLNDPSFAKYLRETAVDLSWFFNGWSELILSENRKRITSIIHQEAAYGRWSKQDIKSGRCEFVLLNANWPDVHFKDPYTKKLKAIDPYWFNNPEVIANDSRYNYIYPVSYPTPGKTFYQLAHHDSIRTSGWLEVHLAIPKFKKYLMENQMTIKYHWKVDERYWEHRYGDRWEKGSKEERQSIRLEWLKEMDTKLANITKTGNSITTPKFWDEVKGQYQEYIELDFVPDPKLDGKYLEDNVEAAANIFYALGEDPTTAGFMGTTKGSQSSGGSNKREAWLIAIALLKPYRDALLEPLHFVAKYNGWLRRYPDLKFIFKDTILTTLNTGKSTESIVS
ncbi:hypothetical protein [Runella zeae]|uniref:hypothetical protein n=1 Tax=Runella zeae TaxID=94255 RepID=UPI000402119E|nr:hypothetical protein [Runella zeae]